MDTAALFAALGLEPHNPAAACGDDWLPGNAAFASENPASGAPLASAGCAGDAEYERVLAQAVQAAAAWRGVPAPKRGQMIYDIGAELRRRKDDLGTLVSLEVGKIKAEGDGEIQEMIDMADFAVGQSRMLYGCSMHSERAQHRMFEQWHPLGVVGVITAFNFPAAVWAWNAFIAAVCGNAVVWKPSPRAPLTAIAIQRIVERVAIAHGHPGVFSLLLSHDAALGGKLAADARVALLSFTGSSAVGCEVAGAVAARIGRCLLECSGNNAIIVDDGADLDLALPAILFGAVGTAGQRCTTTRRLIVHERIHDELAARLCRAYAQVRVGDPLDPATLMGPLIDAAARSRYLAAIAEARAAGGEVLHGGAGLDRAGYFVTPAIVAARPQWPMVGRETFGPLLYLMRYRELEEAIAINNAVPQGLSSALFTRDLRHAERFLAAGGSDCGIANINIGTSGAEIGGAFGGEKDTGGGREAGSDAWKAYMRRQTATINWGRSLPLAQGIRFDLGGA